MLRTSSSSYVERLAWLVMIGSFAMLCVICTVLTSGVYTFFFTSTVAMNTSVNVARGTAVLVNSELAEQAVRLDEATITGRVVTVSMDSQSQSTLSMYSGDKNDDVEDVLVAAITLKASSELRFIQAVMPRFEWTNASYHVVIRDFVGQLDVLVTSQFDRSFIMEIYTTNGKFIQINKTGRYSIDATENRVRVSTIVGEAVLFSNNRNENRVVPTGTDAVLYAERTQPSVYPAKHNLLDNGLFSFATTDTTTTRLPERWGCFNSQDDLPRGVYALEDLQGRSVLRLARADRASSHGETRCLQPISPNSRDVTQFNYLELEASFMVDFQSLADCGTRGSECPLMLYMTYTDVSGVAREWFQGFYYAYDPSVSYPPRCESCSQDHLLINGQVWYTFETGNLFAILPPSAKPAKINTVEFYASGHQYDVYVSEIMLSVGYIDAVPDAGTG